MAHGRNPENQRTPGRGRSRREVLSLAVQALAVGTGAAVSGALARARGKKAATEKREEELSAENPENWKTSELTLNRIGSFKIDFGNLTRKQILLIDQNGNPVTGGPIDIPEELLKEEDTKGFKEKFQAWLTALRNKLKREYPTMYLDHTKGREEPTALSVRLSLDRASTGSFFDQVAMKSNKPVSKHNPASRYAFAKTKLNAAVQQGVLPPSLGKLLIGVTGVESEFSDVPENKYKCAGAWQISRDEALQYHIYKPGSFDARGDFEAATDAAVKIYADLYQRLSRDRLYASFKALYGLNDEEFTIPIVINSYISGETGVKNMCRWFQENYPVEKVENILGKGPYGQDLYTFMTAVYMHGEDRPATGENFGPQSRDYVNRVFAMAELFEERDSNKQPDANAGYEPPAPAKESEAMEAANGIEQTIGIGLLGSAGALAAADIVGNTGAETRRKFIQRAALTTALGIGSSFAGKAAAEKMAAQRGREEKEAPQPEKVPTPQEFAPYILDTNGVTKAILETVRVFPVKPLEARKVFQLKDTVGPGLAVAHRLKLPQFETAEDIGAAAGIVDVPQYATKFYRLRGVGQKKDGVRTNDLRYAKCYAHTEGLMREIDERFNTELTKVGFPEQFHVRLIVSSLSRDREFQKGMKNANKARGESPHTFGHTLDVHRAKFDIIDTSGAGNRFCMVSNATKDPTTRLRLVDKLNAVLGRVLYQMKQEGKITVVHEGANPVYHMSDLKPLGSD